MKPYVILLVVIVLDVFARNVHAQNAIESEDITVEQVAELTTTRATKKELRRMATHLESLYSRKDVWHQFKNESGQDIDCVDFFAQPGARHVKGLVRPSSGPLVIQTPSGPMELQTRDPAGEHSFDEQGREQTCPEGSVPIVRQKLQNIARFETLESFLSKVPVEHGGAAAARAVLGRQADEPPAVGEHYYATVHNRMLSNRGARTTINIWKPYLERWNEFSLSQLWVYRALGGNVETVEAGWQVYKNRYDDLSPHFFIYYSTDDYNNGCYNLDCSAFLYLGGLPPASTLMYSVPLFGPQREMTFAWAHCSETECGIFAGWWLSLAGNWIGFYPIDLFDSSGIRDMGYAVEFGGEVLEMAQYERTATDMGSGVAPGIAPFNNCNNGASSSCYGWVAYQRRLRYYDLSKNLQPVHNLIVNIEKEECYTGELYFQPGGWDKYIFFGGTGADAEGCD